MCKLFAKIITDELATVHDYLCNVQVLYLLCCIVSFLCLATIYW